VYIKWINLIEKELKGKPKIIVSVKDKFLEVYLEEFFRNTELVAEFVDDCNKVIDFVSHDPFYQIVIVSVSENDRHLPLLIKNLKEINPNIKVFIILNYFKEEDLGRYFEMGVDEIILTPFTLNEFKARIAKLLKEHYLDIKLQKFIIEDPLTNVYNRRYFEEIIREEVYKALRQKYSLSLMMIDLDKFKWYNDNFGHQEGDKLLKSFGEILWKNVREKVDKVCRYGGDEFVVILPYTSWKNAVLIAERICKAWEEKGFNFITLSIGIAQLIKKEDLEKSIADLINRADKAMYEAKKEKVNSWKVDEESVKQFLSEESQGEERSSQSLL